MIIKSVNIKNFRSIISEKIQLNDVVVLVGNNDVGKSNFLKALNLFFNNLTDFNTKFDFENDYCKLSKAASKMAAEIVITLEIIPPKSYKAEKNILWTRVWRRQGFYTSRERKIFVDKTPIDSSRSRVNHWLEHLKFRYVPATKSDNYFQELLGDLHDTLAESVEKEIVNAAHSFTQKIQESTSDISSELDSRMGLNSILQLPQDLRRLFQILDFETTSENIKLSLKNRGDGIKTRHIPIILKFLAEQDNKTRTKGAPLIDTIWGFEEPENNLELTKAFELAKDFYEYSKNLQILLTTHSSAFYGMKTIDVIFPEIKKFDGDTINIYYIEKSFEKKTSIVNLIDKNLGIVNEKMGLLPLITPFIRDKVKINKELLESIEKLKSDYHNLETDIIVFEGLTDKDIIEKSIELFNPELYQRIRDNKITLIASNNAGVNWVSDFIKAWFYLRKNYRVLAILDNDDAAKECKNELFNIDKKSQKKNKEGMLKIINYNNSEYIISIKKKGINLPVTLEELYSFRIWDYMANNAFLEERRGILTLLKDFSLYDSIDNHIKNKLGLNEEEAIYCLNKVKFKYKKKIVKYILKNTEENIREDLEFFKPIVISIDEYLGKDI